jgi:hypothetical protein
MGVSVCRPLDQSAEARPPHAPALAFVEQQTRRSQRESRPRLPAHLAHAIPTRGKRACIAVETRHQLDRATAPVRDEAERSSSAAHIRTDIQTAARAAHHIDATVDMGIDGGVI